jgi:TonB family protein
MKTLVSRPTTVIMLLLFTSLSFCFAQKEGTSFGNTDLPAVQSNQLADPSTTFMDVKAVEASMLLAEQSVEFVASDVYVDASSRHAKKGLLRDKDKGEFKNVETYPVPENGVELGSVLRGLIEYPQCAIDQGIEGVVKVLCTVEKDGSVSSVVILNDIGANCAEEVCKIVRDVKFKPAMQNGYPRRCTLIIPVVFDLTQIG